VAENGPHGHHRRRHRLPPERGTAMSDYFDEAQHRETMSKLVQLASDANEAGFSLKEAIDSPPNILPVIKRAQDLLAAVDALTGAIVEEANR
jgi:hypothetical protein